MKVLLSQDVEKLGWIGDVVEVKSGYARNYLIPYRIAVVPTEGNMKALAKAKAKGIEDRKLVRGQLEKIAEAVEGAEVVVSAKANEQGHLFGSVTAKEIAENLREQTFEIKDEMVIADHIKEVGTHQVTLKVAADLTAAISVVVVSQDETVESNEDDNDE
jgi:large subunit ribosomal protein L9